MNLTQRAQRPQSLAPPLGELASEARLRGFHTQRTQRAQSSDNVHQLPLPPMSANAKDNSHPTSARPSRQLPSQVPLVPTVPQVPLNPHAKSAKSAKKEESK